MNRRIIAAVDDLFFASKIRGTAEQLGIRSDFPKSAEAIIAEATRDAPALLLVDLHAKFCDPFALAERFKQDQQLRGVTIVGFFSHVQTEMMQRARRAGLDQVLPRSVFSKRLAEILRGDLRNDDLNGKVVEEK